MAKILFFNPSLKDIYRQTNVRAGAPHYPSLTLATLAGHLIKEHRIKIVDLDLIPDSYNVLFNEIKDFCPDIIASTAATPVYFQVKDIMRRIKETCPQIKTVLGGAHVTALPEEAGKEDHFDVIVIGEGDRVIPELLSSSSEKSVKGIAYKDNTAGARVFNEKRSLIQDLNALPFPSW